MTQEEAKKLVALAPIIQAFAEGKTIQYYFCGDCWDDIKDPDFGAEPERYRVKPEPRDFWINVYPSAMTRGNIITGSPFTSKEEADKKAMQSRIECIHVREVL